MGISRKVADRITSGIKRYQAILAEARRRDISESDTAVIVGDMLADMLGYKKYIDITTEFAIRNTYVDLAVKVGEDIRFLIEVKPIGVLELKDAHVKQAIDYGANQGIEWVLLTNAANWRVYKINFQQPIDKSLVFDLDLLAINPRDPEVLDWLYTLSREGFTQSSMTALLQQRQATSKFSVAAVLLSDSVVTAARRELRRRFPDVRIEDDLLRSVIEHEALKREVVDSDEARTAQQILKRSARKAARTRAKDDEAVVAKGDKAIVEHQHLADAKAQKSA